MSGFLLQASGLARVFPLDSGDVAALHGVDLGIRDGEFVAIMGPSGSGKSTLMHLLGCLDSPTTGSLHIRGRDVAGLAPDELAAIRNRTIGFVFQDFNLLARSTALENVEMPLIYGGIPPDSRRERARVALARVGLSGREHHVPSQLSGGEQQRVAIARALVNDPALILADEPTGNLDSRTGADILQIFRDLHRQGITVLLITHDATVAAVANRQIRLQDGRIVEDKLSGNKLSGDMTGFPKEIRIVSPESETPSKEIRIVSPDNSPKDVPSLSTESPSARGSLDPLLRVLDPTLLLTAFRLGMQALRRSTFRSLLTTLGIVIGVGSIITIAAVGKNFFQIIQHQIFRLASNRVIIRPDYRPRGKGDQRYMSLTVDDAAAIRSVCRDATAVAPVLESGTWLEYRGRRGYARLIGTNAEYPAISGSEMEEGHFLTSREVDMAGKVCVISWKVAQQLFPDRSPLGRTLRIRSVAFEVIGVLKSSGGNLSIIGEPEIYLPYTTFQRYVEKSRQAKHRLECIEVGVRSGHAIPFVANQIDRLLRWRHGITGGKSPDFRLRDTREIALIVGGMLSGILLFITFIASISLAVGGIGIMNIMLVSVTERTREIGVRLAIGARRLDIMLQFLVESVTLSGLGGLTGIGLGLSLAFLAQVALEAFVVGFCQFDLAAFSLVVVRFLHYPLVSLGICLLAFGFAAGVGIFFGLYPAWKASRLDPIRALRTV